MEAARLIFLMGGELWIGRGDVGALIIYTYILYIHTKIDDMHVVVIRRKLLNLNISSIKDMILLIILNLSFHRFPAQDDGACSNSIYIYS